MPGHRSDSSLDRQVPLAPAAPMHDALAFLAPLRVLGGPVAEVPEPA